MTVICFFQSGFTHLFSVKGLVGRKIRNEQSKLKKIDKGHYCLLSTSCASYEKMTNHKKVKSYV